MGSKPNVLNNQYGAYFGIANADPLTNERCININYIAPPYNWHNFTRTWLTKAYQRGFRRAIIWMPFGQDLVDGESWLATLPLNGFEQPIEGHLLLDHYLRCPDDEEYGTLKTTFVPAFREWLAEYNDFELICYTGNIWTQDSVITPDWSQMTNSVRTNRFWDSLTPFLDLNASIGFDASGAVAEDHWLNDKFNELVERGTRVYIEAYALWPNTNLSKFNFICLTNNYKDNIIPFYYGPEWNNGEPITEGSSAGFMGIVPKSQITGEKVMLLVDEPVTVSSIQNYHKAQTLNHLIREDVDSVFFTVSNLVDNWNIVDFIGTNLKVN